MFSTMYMQDKRVLIFGGTGSLGQALIKRLSKDNCLNVFSRDEAKHWTIRNKLLYPHNVVFSVGDIRDKRRVCGVIKSFRPEILIIASALKQVETCEAEPFESIQTNILGTQNVVDAVEECSWSPDSVLFVSTDKACSPVNVYGMSKAISERIVTSSRDESGSTKYCCVRYGNVLESRGSIIPLFRHQSKHRNTITVTHQEMTRYVMTLDDSVSLIDTALARAVTGETWLPKLKAMRIVDLAELFAERYGKEIEIIGVRPGEKIHEELLDSTEAMRTRFEADYFVLSSVLDSKVVSDECSPQSSDKDLLSKVELESYLNSLNIFDRPDDSFVGREISEIVTRL